MIETSYSSADLKKFTYDDNDRVIQTDEYASGVVLSTFKYTYNNSGITEVDISYIKGGVMNGSFTVPLTLDNNQRVTVRDLGTQGSIHYYSQFIYDNPGNILSATTTGTSNITYTYDSHKVPFVNAKGNFYFFLEGGEIFLGNANNLLTAIGTNLPQTIYTYTYDPDGYPASRTTTKHNSFDQSLITLTDKYNYTLQ